MPSSFHGISMASNALRAFQRGMDVAGHNLSNVNTRGYSRQTVDYEANQPTSFWLGKQHALGQGVTISSINRIRDQFLDARMQASQGDAGRYNTLSTMLGQVEPVFNEPGPNGISNAFDQFFNAWSGLASNPNAPANLLEVQSTGQTLANRVRNTYGALNARRTQIDGEIKGTVTEINRIANRIHELNSEIRAAMSTTGAPNDLLDERDLAVDELSQYVNITTHQGEAGNITVHFGGFPLVDVAGAYPFPPNVNSAAMTVSNSTHTFPVRGGKLLGLMEARNSVQSSMDSLNNIADALRDQVNSLHMTGTNPNGTTNLYFFNQNAVDPQNGAIDFDLSAPIKQDINNIAFGVSGNSGDGGLALAMSNLRTAVVPDLGGKTFSDYYSTVISRVGNEVRAARESADTFASIVGQIENQRQSISGVSIDDEMANMIKMQRSYQAAAKALSVFDQMTEELIGLIR